MACNFCKTTIYIKTVKYSASLLAPLTPAEALRQQLEDLTGEVYVRLSNNFCPMCGECLIDAKGAENNEENQM